VKRLVATALMGWALITFLGAADPLIAVVAVVVAAVFARATW
jgi:hypothetical protein